jgi:ATP-dependent Clp protease ATP-binding subunit ClpA
MLDEKAIDAIFDVLIEDVKARFAQVHHVELEITPACKSAVIKNGTNLDQGARPLKRAIDQTLITELTRGYTQEQFNDGDKIIVDFQDGKFKFDVIERATVSE